MFQVWPSVQADVVAHGHRSHHVLCLACSKSIISEDRGKNPRLRHLFQTAGGARAKAFDLAFLGKIWEKCRRSADEDIAHGHEEWEMTREQFHDFMRENFGTSKQALVEVDKLFDELDTNKECVWRLTRKYCTTNTMVVPSAGVLLA